MRTFSPKGLSFFFILFFVAGTAYGQSSEQAISYFNPADPIFDWPLPGNWGTYEMIGLTERITLPTDSGYVDSVHLVFDQLTGDSLEVGIDPDTTIETQLGTFHLDDAIFSTSGSDLALISTPIASIAEDTSVTIVFPHVPVGQNFHIFVTAFNDAGQVATLFIRGDSEAIVPLTEDNTHATWIGVGDNEVFNGIIDSEFVPGSDTVALYSNFDITAYVQTFTSGVSTETKTPTLSIFPNPASSYLQISGAATSVELFDPLGRSALTQTVRGTGRVDVTQIPNGNYEAVVHSATGTVTVPVIIQH